MNHCSSSWYIWQCTTWTSPWPMTSWKGSARSFEMPDSHCQDAYFIIWSLQPSNYMTASTHFLCHGWQWVEWNCHASLSSFQFQLFYPIGHIQVVFIVQIRSFLGWWRSKCNTTSLRWTFCASLIHGWMLYWSALKDVQGYVVSEDGTVPPPYQTPIMKRSPVGKSGMILYCFLYLMYPKHHCVQFQHVWCWWMKKCEHDGSLHALDNHLVHSCSCWHQQVNVGWITSGSQQIAWPLCAFVRTFHWKIFWTTYTCWMFYNLDSIPIRLRQQQFKGLHACIADCLSSTLVLNNLGI